MLEQPLLFHHPVVVFGRRQSLHDSKLGSVFCPYLLRKFCKFTTPSSPPTIRRFKYNCGNSQIEEYSAHDKMGRQHHQNGLENGASTPTILCVEERTNGICTSFEKSVSHQIDNQINISHAIPLLRVEKNHKYFHTSVFGNGNKADLLKT